MSFLGQISVLPWKTAPKRQSKNYDGKDAEGGKGERDAPIIPAKRPLNHYGGRNGNIQRSLWEYHSPIPMKSLPNGGYPAWPYMPVDNQFDDLPIFRGADMRPGHHPSFSFTPFQQADPI